MIAQVRLYLFLVFEVQRDGSVYLHERTGHEKGAEDAFRRFAILEAMNNAVEGNTRTGDVLAAVMLLDVVCIFRTSLPVYAAWTPGDLGNFVFWGPEVVGHRGGFAFGRAGKCEGGEGVAVREFASQEPRSHTLTASASTLQNELPNVNDGAACCARNSSSTQASVDSSPSSSPPPSAPS
jgi:hypothetical protein